MHGDMQNICLSLAHGLTRTCRKILLLVSSCFPSAGEDDGISRLACGAQGGTKYTNSGGEDASRGGKRDRGRAGALGGGSKGSGQEEGPPLEFVLPSMGLEMIGIYPDRTNLQALSSAQTS